jgi:hypothetical protein
LFILSLEGPALGLARRIMLAANKKDTRVEEFEGRKNSED